MAAGFAISITAIDAATAQIDKINKRMAALRAPAENLHKSLAKFADMSGMKKAWEAVHAGIHKAFQALEHFVPLLGALTAGGIVAGLARIVETWETYATHLAVTSKWLGLLPQQLQTLENANRLMGGSAADAAASYQALDDSLQDAVAGRNIEALRFFTALGINIHKSALEAKSAADIMPELYEKIHNSGGNAAVQRRLAEFAHLTPQQFRLAKEEGAAGLARQQATAARYSLRDDEIKQLDKEREAYTTLTLAVENFASRIAIQLGPVLQPYIDSLTVWLSNSDNVESATRTLTETVKTISTHIMALAKGVDHVVEAIGGWDVALEIVGGLLVLKLLNPLTSIGLKITELLALRLAPWMLGMLGLSGSAAVVAGAGVIAGGVGAYKSGKQTATAGEAGFRASQTDEFGNVTEYVNPTTGEKVPALEMDDYLKKHPPTPITGGAPGSNSGDPRGIRNNNPGNLSYLPGQGAIGTDGRFGVFKTMEEGIAASVRQITFNQDKHGINTISGMISRWAPANENNTESYIASIEKKLGKGRNERLNFHDEATASALMAGIAKVETGRDLDPNVLAKGVKLGLNGSPAAPSQVAGQIQVDINHNNAPPGSSVTASSSGGLLGAPRVVQPMLGYL